MRPGVASLIASALFILSRVGVILLARSPSTRAIRLFALPGPSRLSLPVACTVWPVLKYREP